MNIRLSSVYYHLNEAEMKKIIWRGVLVGAFLLVGNVASAETMKIYAGSGDGQAGIGEHEVQVTWNAARSYEGNVTYTTQDTFDSNTSRSDFVLGSYRLYRGSLPFDTSVIPEDAVITSVKLNLYGYNNNGSQGGALACVTTHTRSDASNVIGDDYHISSHGETPLASFVALANEHYTIFDLSEEGINQVNSNGVSFFSVRTHFDCLDIDPGSGGGTSIAVNWYSSEAAGTEFDPYLEITYTVPEVDEGIDREEFLALVTAATNDEKNVTQRFFIGAANQLFDLIEGERDRLALIHLKVFKVLLKAKGINDAELLSAIEILRTQLQD